MRISGMRHDILRAGFSVLLLAALAAWGLPFWLSLTLPLLMYVGLWLLVAPPVIGPPSPQRVPEAGVDTAFERCGELRSRIAELSGQLDDAGVRGQLQSVTACVDKSLAAISEDGKYEAALPLSELLEFTDKLLSAYVKVVRRGFAEPGIHLHVCERLGTIDRACSRFWDRLNRDAVVDLRALSETIDVLLDAASRSSDDGGDLPGSVLATETDPDGADQLAPRSVDATSDPPLALPVATRPNHGVLRLTRTELEILCLLPSGKTDQEIADERFISPRTVSKHVEGIYGKLGVRNRAEAVAFAVRHGICPDDPIEGDGAEL